MCSSPAHGHHLISSQNVLCDPLMLFSCLPEEENEVHRGPLLKGHRRVSGLSSSCSWYLPQHRFPTLSAVLSLWSPVLPAISCPVCLTHTLWAVFWGGGCGESDLWLVPMVLGPSCLCLNQCSTNGIGRMWAADLASVNKRILFSGL